MMSSEAEKSADADNNADTDAYDNDSNGDGDDKCIFFIFPFLSHTLLFFFLKI
jgi:hypothetical protein